MPTIAFFLVIRHQIPIDANGNIAWHQCPQQPKFAEIANIPGIPVLHNCSPSLFEIPLILYEKTCIHILYLAQDYLLNSLSSACKDPHMVHLAEILIPLFPVSLDRRLSLLICAWSNHPAALP
jgi:hypothetical protein